MIFDGAHNCVHRVVCIRDNITGVGRRGEGRRVGGREGERELDGEKDSNTTIPGTHLNTL